MDNRSIFSRPDLINLVLIVVVAALSVYHMAKTNTDNVLIATQEAKHVRAITAELKTLKLKIRELESKKTTQTIDVTKPETKKMALGGMNGDTSK